MVCALEALLTDSRRDKVTTVSAAGGIGIILVDPLGKDIGFQLPIPGSVVTPLEAADLQAYLATET